MKRILLIGAAVMAFAAASSVYAGLNAENAQPQYQQKHEQLELACVPEKAVQASVASAPAESLAQARARLAEGDAFGALMALLFGAGGVGWAMTTLAANKPRDYELGNRNAIPVIASDIIYEGAAVGVVAASGHARPLVAGDVFAGFAERKADNSAGAAAAINVDVVSKGEIQLSVTGAVITDVGQPVYASDDDTFTLNPASGTFVGFVKRFVSSGVAVVEFDALAFKDPWAAFTVRETLSAIKTFDAEDSGKLFCVDADADGDALTLPAVADGFAGAVILAVGAFGTTAVTISPAAADNIRGPDITAADDKDLILTKATQRRGDFVKIEGGDADGYVVTQVRGIWARQA